ncbi:MAG: 50S ribosomal protein L7ae-like protein [Tissierellia bacterium]|nr:50S ribosomal protein L7ae-like protein [Tissierellia bacterium]
MDSELNTDNKVVGAKQVKGMLARDKVRVVYIAEDAEGRVIEDIVKISDHKQIRIIYVESMRKLGEACGIDVNAASAALLK